MSEQNDATPGPVWAYIDTNVLIEFRRLKDHQWLAFFGAPAAVLVICREVFGELDGFKDKPGAPRSKKQRAADVARDLDALLESPAPVEIQTGVTLEYDDNPIPPEVYGEHLLDRELVDHRIVAAALAAKQRNPERRICFVAADGGARRSALRCRLEAFRPAETMKLGDEPDPVERDLREAKREIALMKSRQPKLSLRFGDGESFMKYVLPKPRLPIEEHARQQLERLRATQPPYADALQAASGWTVFGTKLIGPPPKADIEAYDRAREAYVARAAEVIPMIIQRRNRIDRHVPFEGLVLENSGTLPAENVRVVLRAPAGTSLAMSLPRARTLPEAPRLPGSWFEGVAVGIAAFHREQTRAANLFEMAAPLFDSRSAPPGWQFDVGQQKLVISLGAMSHDESETLPLLYLNFVSYDDAKSVALDFELKADNVASSEKGQLHLVLEKGDRMSPLELMGEEADADGDGVNDAG